MTRVRDQIFNMNFSLYTFIPYSKYLIYEYLLYSLYIQNNHQNLKYLVNIQKQIVKYCSEYSFYSQYSRHIYFDFSHLEVDQAYQSKQ